MPIASNAKARCSGSSGSSIGWVVNHQFSRRYSDGGLRSRVISASPNARQASSIVHESDAAQAMPVSTATTCRSGISSNSARADHRQHLPRHRRAEQRVHVEVVRGPARTLRLGEPAGVERDGQPRLGRGPEHRPVAAVAEPLLQRAGQQHLHEAVVARQSLDLRHRQIGVLVRRADRAEQPRVLVQPLLARPVVQRGAQRGRELRRLGAEGLRLHRREDRVVHVVLVEQLRLDEPDVRAREALLGPRVDAVAAVAHPRVHRVGARDAGTELREMALPPRAQPRVHRGRQHDGVDVASTSAIARSAWSRSRSVSWTSVMRSSSPIGARCPTSPGELADRQARGRRRRRRTTTRRTAPPRAEALARRRDEQPVELLAAERARSDPALRDLHPSPGVPSAPKRLHRAAVESATQTPPSASTVRPSGIAVDGGERPPVRAARRRCRSRTRRSRGSACRRSRPACRPGSTPARWRSSRPRGRRVTERSGSSRYSAAAPGAGRRPSCRREPPVRIAAAFVHPDLVAAPQLGQVRHRSRPGPRARSRAGRRSPHRRRAAAAAPPRRRRRACARRSRPRRAAARRRGACRPSAARPSATTTRAPPRGTRPGL